MWSTIRPLRMPLPMWWRWLTTLDCEMLSLPDTLWVLLAGFTSMSWSPASGEYSVLGRFQQYNYCTLINCTIIFRSANIFRRFPIVQSRKAYFPELDYVSRWSARFLNHTRSDVTHNVSAHQLPRYYQPQRVLLTAWTASVTWYANRYVL